MTDWPEPVFTAATERAWARLPEHFRTSDALQVDWPFKRWLAGIFDTLSEVETLGAAVGLELLDAAGVRAEWLPYLGQLVGVRDVTGLVGESERRDAVRFASSGWRTGTGDALADAARSALEGPRYVAVHPHSTSEGVGLGGPWDVLLVTRPSETPDPAVVLDAVERKGARPAGVRLWHKSLGSTWAVLHQAYPTWASRRGRTWRDLHESSLLVTDTRSTISAQSGLTA